MEEYCLKKLLPKLKVLAPPSGDRIRANYDREICVILSELNLSRRGSKKRNIAINKAAKVVNNFVWQRNFHSRALLEFVFLFKQEDFKIQTQTYFYLYVILLTYPELYFHHEGLNFNGFNKYFPFTNKYPFDPREKGFKRERSRLVLTYLFLLLDDQKKKILHM